MTQLAEVAAASGQIEILCWLASIEKELSGELFFGEYAAYFELQI